MVRVYQDPRSPLRCGRRAWFIDYRDLDGRRRRERTTATTKAEAETILRSRLSEMAKAKIVGARSLEAVRPMSFEGSAVSHAFQRAVRAAGLTNLRFHDLRHTFASRLVQAGVPLNTVRELLGHRSMAMVLRYAHLAPRNLREAIDAMEGAGRREALRVGTNPAQNVRPKASAF